MIISEISEMDFLNKFLTDLERRLSKAMRTVDTGYIDFILFDNGNFAFDVILPPNARGKCVCAATEIIRQIIYTRMLIIKRKHCEK